MKEIVFSAITDKPLTLENFLTKKGVSKRLLKKLKHQENGMTRNGILIRSVDTVNNGDTIVLRISDDKFLEPNGNLDIPTAYEDDNIIVFNKPAGIPVHPSLKHHNDTLGNYFAYLFPELTYRPVHRLDNYTSGLCMVAKDSHSANVLQGNFRKVYYAVVHGITDEYGTIDAPLARREDSIILRCVREDGQKAITHYKRLKYNNKYSLLEINLETGRTHQIRVHFSHIGHPLAGDELYGGNCQDIQRQSLHCGRLEFNQPVTGQHIIVNADFPEDIKNLSEL
ncbi:MAG: RluA family pseudouridine synthase [Ruminococcus sp.]|nr:RluA family pseudouridine synthase [Ruminococcus sp.]